MIFVFRQSEARTDSFDNEVFGLEYDGRLRQTHRDQVLVYNSTLQMITLSADGFPNQQ